MKVFKMLLFGAVAAGIAWGVWYGFFRDEGTEYVYRTQFRLAISTSAPINSCTDEANALPV